LTSYILSDWKESPGQVFEDLEPVLRKCGIYLLEDPGTMGSDTYGYILTDKKRFTIGDYIKLQRAEFGKEGEDETRKIMEENGLKDGDVLQKLVDKVS
jgi:hypothetical protein